MLFRVELPPASTTRRFDRPCVYSWYRISAEFDELVATVASSPGLPNRYICIVGAMPSGGVLMLALLMWFASGPPFGSVAAPSIEFSRTGSPPSASNEPAALVKLIGGLASQ